MMHFEEVVVTLVDSNNKPFRELNANKANRGRKCDVFAPVDTEYKFLIKNNTDRRIKVDIDIDGTCVTRNGLILNAFESDYIERFVDIDKKFKTSLKTGEGVADPTSPENGIIKVRVRKEKMFSPPPLIPVVREEHHHHHHHDVWWGNYNHPHNSYPLTYTSRNEPTYGGVLRGCDNIGATKGSDAGGSSVAYTASCSNADVPTKSLMSFNAVDSKPAESLATVEGSKSNQSFASTFWIGEDPLFGEIVFTFFLKLAAQAVDPEYAEFLRLKQKFETK